MAGREAAGAGGGDDELTLLGVWTSPFVIRARAALNLKGLAYLYLEDDLTTKSELLLASNPAHGKVPVLLHSGRPVCESRLILEYLDEAFPARGPRLLPAGDPTPAPLLDSGPPTSTTRVGTKQGPSHTQLTSQESVEGNIAMAGKEDLKLLGLEVSPFVIRVRMALGIKGVSYEYVEEDLPFNKSDLLLASNPVHKKVPVLIHNGKPVCESLVIAQYVDELFAGPPILPADPYERTTARFWAAFVDDKLVPAWIGILKAKTEDERAEKATETLAAIGQVEAALASKLADGRAFFGGDSIGYLDIVLGSCLFWFEALRMMHGVEIIDSGRTPVLAAWAERFGESAEAKGVVPGAHEAVKYANKLAAAAAAATK